MQKLPRSDIIKHMHRLVSRWPSDPLRPASVSIPAYIQSRLSPRKPEQSQSESSLSSRLTSLFGKKQEQQPQSQPSTSTPPEAPLLSTENINVLYSLLENRYQKKYPLTRKLRYPDSQPEYYDNLIQELDEAPSRSFAGRLKKKFTGFLRLK
ncbi:hypothetical protein FQN57_000409 [Myotisia sp. PD_48]|nr:hypothetical protein FQN57_000409 [Myotisia sp. PD_48]